MNARTALHVESISKFPTFCILKLGMGMKDADGYRAALKQAKCGISDWANNIFGKPGFTVSREAREVELVVAPVAELGWKDGATWKDIYQRAEELGLALCPAEAGPQLRLQYQKQPKNEWLVIAMKPIADSDNTLSVFSVRHDERRLWLSANHGYPGYLWSGSCRLVFLRRK
jgi:hypothetical protein